MEIYLKHNQHGKKIAHDFKESEEDKKYGWEQVSKEDFFTVNKFIHQEENEKSERDALIQKYMDKFGKMPDGRLSAVKIKAAMENNNDQAA